MSTSRTCHAPRIPVPPDVMHAVAAAFGISRYVATVNPYCPLWFNPNKAAAKRALDDLYKERQ